MPLVQKPGENLLAIGRKAVEALVALVFFAPLAYQQPLRFEPAKQGVKRALVDLKASLGEVLAERVAVVLLAKLSEHCERQTAPAKLQAKVSKRFSATVMLCLARPSQSRYVPYTVLHILYDNQCMTSSGFSRFILQDLWR